MKKNYLLIAFIVVSITAAAQSIGIGTTTPNASAMLEIKASNKGLLIPRTSTTTRTAIVNPAKGLLIYDSTTSSFWFHDGGSWIQIGAGGNGWSLTGNTGTNPATNFLGTTDAQPLVVKINNTKAGLLTTNGNVFWGLGSGNSNTGYSNIGIGIDALKNNTTRSNLVAIGDSALYNNGTGAVNSTEATFNTAIGSKALFSNTIGYHNTATGANALYANTGSFNTATGAEALYYNISGSFNTATGRDALYSNTFGVYNTANGAGALFYNTTGSYNTANGLNALLSNTTGSNNTANGAAALFYDTTGSNNTANGASALYFNTTGNYNMANGYDALSSNTSGSNNTANGSYALNSNTTGNYNTALGTNADVTSAGLTNATAIGANALVGISNAIELGDANVTSVNTFGTLQAHGYRCKPGAIGTFRGNEFNIDWTPGGAAQLWIDVTNLGTISFTSDRRLKENVDLMKGNGIERMMELKPVHFKYKKIEGTIFSGSTQEQEGFIADELQQVIPSAVNGEKNALTSKGTIQPQTVNIVPVVAVLTKAVQEQQQIIEDLKKENSEQEKKIDLQQQQINSLLKDIQLIKEKLK